MRKKGKNGKYRFTKREKHVTINQNPPFSDRKRKIALSRKRRAIRGNAKSKREARESNMKIVTFGEMMLRLTPLGTKRLVQADSFDAFYGGAEANVALSLALLGEEAVFATKLPDNALGDGAVAALRRWGVDTRGIVRGKGRLGLVFQERGADRRPDRTFYDREGSALSLASPSEFDWERLLAGADFLYFSGITPALGENVAGICIDACQAARKCGVQVAFDPNYRPGLWDLPEAAACMETVLSYVDILIANESQASALFGISYSPLAVDGDNVSDWGYETLAKALCKRFPLKAVALTERRTISAGINDFSAKYYDGRAFVSSPKYRMRVVDRVGSGDAFAAGLLFSLGRKTGLQEAINFAAAAGCLKHSIEGDVNLSRYEEILALAQKGAEETGRK